MTLIPIVLDLRPGYLGEAATESLLLLPGPGGALMRELARSIAAVTPTPPSVLAAFTPDAAYVARLRAACPDLAAVLTPASFSDVVGDCDASDVLLLVSPGRWPAGGLDLRGLCSRLRDASMVRHLLAFEATPHRTKELVQTAADGRLRSIQRYFHPVTWPFPAGPMASLVPVACVQMMERLPLWSLDELRRALSARGTPASDDSYHDETFDLEDEDGLLAFMERRVSEQAVLRGGLGTSPDAHAECAPSASVHSTARLIGRVHVAANAVVEAGALVVGPSVIGEGARVEADAVVAQCLVLPGATIAQAVTVRHRVVIPRAAREPGCRHRRHPAPARTDERATREGARRSRIAYVTVKAIADRVGASLALALLAPLMLLLALLVRLGSRGPVFYGDLREGMGGRPFRCWKFRSMRTNADAMQRALAAEQQMDGPQFKMDRDPRVTALGVWLRRLNADELPQLWNVARGEMSIIGPRPSPFRENQICVPWRHGRLSVRPGITGLWQVCRHDRALADFHQWIQYDLLYVKHLSFALDLKIFLATIVTLGGKRPVPVSLVIGRTRSDRSATSGRGAHAESNGWASSATLELPQLRDARRTTSGSAIV
jgi:lipopolysaccharide/colanic/teichoic acid biosynthesis glycosyltransferase